MVGAVGPLPDVTHRHRTLEGTLVPSTAAVVNVNANVPCATVHTHCELTACSPCTQLRIDRLGRELRRLGSEIEHDETQPPTAAAAATAAAAIAAAAATAAAAAAVDSGAELQQPEQRCHPAELRTG